VVLDSHRKQAAAAMNATALAIWAARGGAIAVLSALICVVLIVLLHPLLQRYALAKPNARSSHRTPTPQGGGIAVMAATLAATAFGLFSLAIASSEPLAVVFVAVLVIACVGAADDIRPLGVAPRLVLQALIVTAVIFSLPGSLHILSFLPLWVERLLLVIGGLWFVNLVNFMDGIDWMTVAEIVPISAGLVVLGCLGALPRDGTAVALALGGAMVGFAYFNRPTAKLFLGDVGSLPIGLIAGWLLVLLAGAGHLAAALLLPLYYLADATLTLLRRLSNGERVWQAHRTHYYQRATDRGFGVTEITARVFAVNICLAVLAVTTVIMPNTIATIAALCCGAALVALLLARFSRGKN
jgi:UDP-N-acetylmuramyl pentapeptide phosphotransferase/UDP-N-acetylglucosamine-1-phosphate transferase